MKPTVSDFFDPVILKDKPTEEDYNSLTRLIDVIEISSQMSYQTVYIIDYYKRGFLYVSDNPLFLCGNTPEQVLRMGYNFYINYVPEEDLHLLLEINQAGFAFFKGIKMEDRLKYNILYNFRINQPNNRQILINHKLSPLILDNSGNIWLAICYVSASSDKEPGNIIISRNKSDLLYKYNLKEKLWKVQPKLKLTRHEINVLMLSAQGLKVAEIGAQLFLATNTVKFHRKRIFQKLNVNNIAEAVSAAANYNLF